MSDHDVDAVVERLKAVITREFECSGRVFDEGQDDWLVGAMLSVLKPGDRLPGGLVCVREADLPIISEFHRRAEAETDK